MVRKEPKFSLHKVTSMLMPYPSNRELKYRIIKQESEKFREIVSSFYKERFCNDNKA